jgi:endoglucanase
MDRRELLQTAIASLTSLGCSLDLEATDEETGRRQALRRGVNLSGAEFGVGQDFCNENLGQFGRAYTYNSERTVAYFAENGITLFRVPFRWERMQPRLGRPLDPAELERLRQVVRWAARHHSAVILDVHNFARYRLRVGGKPTDVIIDQRLGDEVPVSRQHFADLWRRLSEVFGKEPAVAAYGLMNEPHDMGASDWKAISQAAVDAIRATDDRKLILIPGNSYSNSHHFARINGPRAWIRDRANQVAYEAHCYFDQDYSGTYRKSYDEELTRDPHLAERCVQRLRPFIDWCTANGMRGFLGEYGAPGKDPRWLEIVRQFLHTLDWAGMESCYWAAGEWWGDYPLSLQPRDDFRTPASQLKIVAPRKA